MAARLFTSLRAIQQAKLKDNNAVPANRPSTNPVWVSNDIPNRSETMNNGSNMKKSPVIPSTKAVMMSSVLILFKFQYFTISK
jgi:hypothetical protein